MAQEMVHNIIRGLAGDTRMVAGVGKFDNAVIEIDGEEVPGLDGAAGEFFRGLRDSGSVESRTPRPVYVVKQPIYVREGAASIVALPGTGKLTIEYHLDYPHHLGEGGESAANSNGAKSSSKKQQIVGFEMSADNFERDIAPARTLREAPHSMQRNLFYGIGEGAEQILYYIGAP